MALGRANVNELADELTHAGLLEEWFAYYELEPWDMRLHAAGLVATLVDSTNDILATLTNAKEWPKRTRVVDCMLGWKRRTKKKARPKRKQTAEQIAAGLAARFGGNFEYDSDSNNQD